MSDAAPTRLTQLDGLRGIAALVVLLCHSVAVFPSLGQIFLNRFAPLGPAETWAVYSPLHVAWNGTAAVSVFFVLSGYVLVLPFIKRRSRVDWGAYFARRLLRLYLPVWGSVLLAVVLGLLISRAPLADIGQWVALYAGPVTPQSAAASMTLAFGGTTLNPALWSLRWEVVFSLALPLYLAFGLVARRAWTLKVLLCLVLTACGSLLNSEPLIYLPVFAIGTVMAIESKRIAQWRVSSWAGVPLLVFALVLLNAQWIHPAGVYAHEALVALGATVLVWLYLSWHGAASFGNTRVSQFLGTISFSLYLVHMPVLFAVVAASSASLPLWACIVSGFVASLIAGVLFYWAVERPAHRFSVWVGKRVRDRLERTPVTTSEARS